MAIFQTGILSCCGLQGFADVGNYVDKYSNDFRPIPNSADSFFKERLIQAVCGSNWTLSKALEQKFMCAAILISVAMRSEQKLADHLLELGFSELKVGNNRNTKSNISIFSMDVEKFEPMFRQWAKDLKEKKPEVKKEPAKKVNPFKAFEPVLPAERNYNRDAYGRFA